MNTLTKTDLERAYRKYNRPEFIHPDPLEFVYRYDSDADREVVGLIAASLAYGRVTQILTSVEFVLGRMGSPAVYIAKCTTRRARRDFHGFKHRFTTAHDMAALCVGIRGAIEKHGSLESCFLSFAVPNGTIWDTLSGFVREIETHSQNGTGFLLPDVSRGSACKRLHLFLRWMVRKDAVDPGCWRRLAPKELMIPLDTHMHRIARSHGLTQRKNAGRNTAIEVTRAFSHFSPEDPVKYDFALTRPGILENRERR